MYFLISLSSLIVYRKIIFTMVEYYRFNKFQLVKKSKIFKMSNIIIIGIY